MSMVMPRAFSSGRRSQSMPVRALTSEVLPWSMWPAVPRIRSRGMEAVLAVWFVYIVPRRPTDKEPPARPPGSRAFFRGDRFMLGVHLDVRPFLERVGQELF